MPLPPWPLIGELAEAAKNTMLFAYEKLCWTWSDVRNGSEENQEVE
jgi:hypothetical protein